jgi:hypothetical protein
LQIQYNIQLNSVQEPLGIEFYKITSGLHVNHTNTVDLKKV